MPLMTTHNKLRNLLLAALLCIGIGIAVSSSPAAAADTRWNYTNGCTLSPDGVPGLYNFRDICNRHDVCYARFSNGAHLYGTNEWGRATCDNIFLSEMNSYCSARFAWWDARRGTCQSAARTYYNAVRAFGIPFYYDNNTMW